MTPRRRASRRAPAMLIAAMLAIAALLPMALGACGRRTPEADVIDLIAQARAALDEDRTEDALDAARRAVEGDPSSAEAHYVLGNAHARAEDYASAEAAYLRSLELDPDDADAHSNLGVVYYRLARLDEAESALRAALERSPDDAEFRYNLGGVLASAGRLDEAVAEFERSMELDPALPEPYLGAGIAYQRQGRRDEALRALETYLSLSDDPEWTAMAREALLELEEEP